MQNIGHGRVFIQAGLWGGYPGATGTATTCAAPTCWRRRERGEPFPLHEPDPADSALAREIAGEHLFDIETTTLPEVYEARATCTCACSAAAPGSATRWSGPTSAVMEDIEGDSCCRATPSRSTASCRATAGHGAAALARCARSARRKAVPVREWMAARAPADPRPAT